MCSNKVYDLIETSKWIKPIGCKWVYKRKRGVDKKVAYGQKLDFDYDETFSPVAILKSVKILLSIMVHLDYEI